jgi:hypothetical protein
MYLSFLWFSFSVISCDWYDMSGPDRIWFDLISLVFMFLLFCLLHAIMCNFDLSRLS